jgi:lysophospholipid acyltransferase
MEVNNGITKQVGGCAMATLKHFCVGIVCLIVHVVVDGYFPVCPSPALGTQNTKGQLSPAFLELSILGRIGYAMLGSLGLQMRYFMAWKLGEAAATSFGYGSNKGAWNGCQNIDLKGWLLAENMSQASKAWNQKTQVWLQTYTYRRFPGGRFGQLMATYAVSAYWHGFYPGYYLSFFTLGLMNVSGDNMSKHVKPYFLPEGTIKKKVYDFAGFLGVHWIKSFSILPFVTSTLENSYETSKRLYFLGVLFTLIGVFVVPMIPVKRQDKKEKAT